MIVRPASPVCSACCKPQKRVVAFLAHSSRDGKPVTNRGGSRMVRLCAKCVRMLHMELRL